MVTRSPTTFIRVAVPAFLLLLNSSPALGADSSDAASDVTDTQPAPLKLNSEPTKISGMRVQLPLVHGPKPLTYSPPHEKKSKKHNDQPSTPPP